MAVSISAGIDTCRAEHYVADVTPSIPEIVGYGCGVSGGASVSFRIALDMHKVVQAAYLYDKLHI